MAKSSSVRSSDVKPSFYAVAQLLGRAMHATEDFFAHSNWLEMAKILKRGGQPTQQLFTGTFERADKIHALGHKLTIIAMHLRSEYLLLLNIYKHEVAHEQENPITPKSLTLLGEAFDVYSAAKKIGKRDRQGKASVVDYFASMSFIDRLEEKGKEMMDHGRNNASYTNHARIAKDAPEHGKDFEGAVALATAADKLIFAPLRVLMDNRDEEATKKQLAIQLDWVNQIVAPPSPSHPLFKEVSD